MVRSSEAMAGCKGTDSCRCFFDVTEQRFLHIEVEMPEGFINSRRTPTCCRGSSFGWLFMLQRGPLLLLLNPLTALIKGRKRGEKEPWRRKKELLGKKKSHRRQELAVSPAPGVTERSDFGYELRKLCLMSYEFGNWIVVDKV
ncbi:unnamed protein product [Linum tenue]|uniref:Uncharacterized protein n=1 Tax=Linum tenue TaxID=586396 RepID=A0AAV0KRD7_9ROSI|nr:unnamed protein product [Linum tenue]